MSNDYNPYAAPASFAEPDYASDRTRPLADLGKRFLGALIDGLLGIVLLPGYGLMVVDNLNSRQPGPFFFVGLALVALGGLALLIAQIYLLATRSQTVGKLMMKTQIYDIQTGRPADPVKTILLRAFVNGLIGAIPCVGPIYSIVDILFIFREDHRCLHDMIAGTIVVDIS